MNLQIIYEDDDIVAVDKPSGILAHGHANSGEEKTVADWVREKYPETENVGEPFKLNNGETIKRPGIVHRLDKETSGVLLVAKTKEGFEHLKKQFQNREIEKIYRTFVWGNFSKPTGIINKSIGRSASDFRKKSAEKGRTGIEREAITEYKVLNQNKEHAYLEVQPKTGRTHQIRAHLKSIGRPVVCDFLYASKKPPALDFKRLALHAFSITFKNLKGDTVMAEAPLPTDFVEAEKQLKNKPHPAPSP
ncbi:MAG: RluA family pseudouridine synthase [Patescibacteria group bacterium]